MVKLVSDSIVVLLVSDFVIKMKMMGGIIVGSLILVAFFRIWIIFGRYSSTEDVKLMLGESFSLRSGLGLTDEKSR